MTPEQWKQIEHDLSFAHGRARIKADGHVITMDVRPEKPLKFVIAVFIDGKIEWKRTHAPAPDAPERKFWRVKKVYLSSPAKRAEYSALAKKRGTPKEMKALYEAWATEGFEMLDPSWPNAKALCRHLRKHCTAVELLPRFDDSPVDEAAQ